MDRGSGRYKGKLPFKCFNCGRVGHYAAKCPHKKVRNQAQESEKDTSKFWQKGKKSSRKSFYAQQDSSASKDSDEPSSEEGTSEFILMAIEDLEGLLLEDEEEEGEVDLEEELRSALEEIDRLKLKCRKQKEILLKCVKEEQNSEVLRQLKVKLEEAKKIEDMLLQQIKDKSREQEKLEEEILCLRRKLESAQ